MIEQQFDIIIYCNETDEGVNVGAMYDTESMGNADLLFYLMHMRKLIDRSVDQILETNEDFEDLKRIMET